MTAAAFQKSASRVLPKLADHRDRQPQLPTAPRLSPSTVKGMGGGHRAARGVDKPNIVLQWLGRAIGPMIEEEKKRSAIAGKIPWPGMGAARIWDWHVGWFHQHAHWPGIPLPSTGPLIPLPYVSGADKTTINGQPAARCGDFGLGLWCGGWMPMNEVYLGSATVWIESARAARTLDVTDHCVLLDPAASPLSKGMIVQSSGDVKIGGFPLPSMTQMAIAAALKPIKSATAAAKGAKAVASIAKRAFRTALPFFRKLSLAEQKVLSRFLKFADIEGSRLFKLGVESDLRRIVRTETGRAQMNKLVDNGESLAIRHTDELTDVHPAYKYGTWQKGACVWPTDRAGFGRTTPTGSTIYYEPQKTLELGKGIGSASGDTVLIHEMSHADTMGRGVFDDRPFQDPAKYRWWKNPDELQAVNVENRYRGENAGPLRPAYQNAKPKDPYFQHKTYPGHEDDVIP